MRSFKSFRHNLVFFLLVFMFVPNVFSMTSNDCKATLQNCQNSATGQQQVACQEQFEICKLSENRQNTQSCVWLGFKNHEGVADKEQQIEEFTGGFARITDEKHINFAGLCRSVNMRCEYVLDWDKTMYYCAGQKREPTRVACCR